MSPEILGVEMAGGLRGWSNDQRRVGSILALGVAVVLLLAAVAVYFLGGDGAAPVYWGLVVLVALALGFEVLLLVLHAGPAQAASAAPAPAPEPSGGATAAGPEAWAPPAAPGAPPVRTLTLRCSDCGTVFDLQDTGERPLHHACPGCGAEGVLRDDVAAPAPAPEESPYAPPGEAAAAAPVQTVKRLKLRCGGCKQVFAIEDTGERPLRRPCPYCGRTGEVR